MKVVFYVAELLKKKKRLEWFRSFCVAAAEFIFKQAYLPRSKARVDYNNLDWILIIIFVIILATIAVLKPPSNCNDMIRLSTVIFSTVFVTTIVRA